MRKLIIVSMLSSLTLGLVLPSVPDHGVLPGLAGQGVGGGADDHGLGSKDSPTFKGLTITGNPVFDLIVVGDVDTVRGILSLRGHATGQTQGGILRLDTSDDYDAAINYYYIQASSDDLLIGPSTDLDSLKYDGGTGVWSFSVPMSVNSDAPATASSAGIKGTITFDNDWVYYAVATNTWKRAALTSWGIPAENVIYAGEDVIYAAEQVVYP